MKQLPPDLSKRILHGEDEEIFKVLPQTTLANLRSRASESAVLWNVLYPLAHSGVSFHHLLSIQPLWGSQIEADDDLLRPFFWGYAMNGDRMPQLDRVLAEVEGGGPKTEVDLFLIGERHLLVIEGKHLSTLGRCSRYQKTRCPEIHGSPTEAACRYWEHPRARFDLLLDFGARPNEESVNPGCHRHYQLARTLLIGTELAAELGLSMQMWLVLPRTRWRESERDWVDFADRVLAEDSWRGLRVVALEDLQLV